MYQTATIKLFMQCSDPTDVRDLPTPLYINKYINTHESIASQIGMKTEESLFLRSFLLRKKENSLFEGNLYERNKRFLILFQQSRLLHRSITFMV